MRGRTVVDLATGQQKGDGTAKSVCRRMDLGGPSDSRAADRLTAFRPFSAGSVVMRPDCSGVDQHLGRRASRRSQGMGDIGP